VAATLLVAAALIAVAAIAMSGSSGSTQPPATTHGAAPPTSSRVPVATVLTPVAPAHPRASKRTAAPDATAVARTGAYLERLNAICVASASGLGSLQHVLSLLASGQIPPATAAHLLDSTIRNRSALLARIDGLPGPPPAQATLGRELRAAVAASRAADLAYQQWVSGLPPGSRGGRAAQSGAAWTAVSQGNASASAAKQAFATAFARAAGRIGVSSRCGHL
jgi:hypothetical protein